MPEPILVVKLHDGTERRTRGVGWNDLQLLQEFLADQVKHSGGNGAESPLKDDMPRIRQLLGLDAQKGK